MINSRQMRLKYVKIYEHAGNLPRGNTEGALRFTGLAVLCRLKGQCQHTGKFQPCSNIWLACMYVSYYFKKHCNFTKVSSPDNYFLKVRCTFINHLFLNYPTWSLCIQYYLFLIFTIIPFHLRFQISLL